MLRWFQQVADGHTVTEVSEIYRISQPSVSRALARLEVELGTPLLRKSGRLLRLTHAGATFKRHVDALIHSLDDGVAAVEQLLDPATGTVRLSFQPSLGSWLVPELVASFRVAQPRVTFQLTRSDGTLGSTPIAEGAVDLELTSRRLHARGRPREFQRHSACVSRRPSGRDLGEDRWAGFGHAAEQRATRGYVCQPCQGRPLHLHHHRSRRPTHHFPALAARKRAGYLHQFPRGD